MLVIYGPDGAIVNRSKNLAGVRRYASKHAMASIHLVGRPGGAGELHIKFDNGARFNGPFASYDVMRAWVDRWRNAKGVPRHHAKLGEIGDRRRRRAPRRGNRAIDPPHYSTHTSAQQQAALSAIRQVEKHVGGDNTHVKRARKLYMEGDYAGAQRAAREALMANRKRRFGNALTRSRYIKKFTVARVRLDRGGYDKHGRYFGGGAPLWYVEDYDAERGMYVRAPTARAARAEALQRPSHWGGWR